MKKINLLFLLWTVVAWGAKAQTFGISGQVVDSLSNEPLPYSVIQLVGPDGKAWFNGVVTVFYVRFFPIPRRGQGRREPVRFQKGGFRFHFPVDRPAAGELEP